MPSTWIERRTTGRGLRYRVRYRLRGSNSTPRLAGTFKTKREAELRERWVAGELAAMRVPDVRSLAEPAPRLTVAQAAKAWQESRIDAAPSTRVLHRVALSRVLPTLGKVAVDELTPAMVGAWVAKAAAGRLKSGRRYARGSLEKSLAALRQVLDHAGVDPNPARDRRVKLPPAEHVEINPPSAEHVERALASVAPRYRLPLLVLEATGMRVGELEFLQWGDIDEAACRWRVSAATAKTRRARWVQVPADLMAHVLALVPPEDRTLDGTVFAEATQERMRTDLGRACRATGVPAFGLHDLRHRRLSLWHREGVPIREVADRAGHARASVTLDVYAHVLVDDREVDRLVVVGG